MGYVSDKIILSWAFFVCKHHALLISGAKNAGLLSPAFTNSLFQLLKRIICKIIFIILESTGCPIAMIIYADFHAKWCIE